MNTESKILEILGEEDEMLPLQLWLRIPVGLTTMVQAIGRLKKAKKIEEFERQGEVWLRLSLEKEETYYSGESFYRADSGA